MRRPILLSCLCLALALLLSAPLSAETLKNKTTGETITGTLTDGEINGQRIVKLDSGGTKFIKMDEWEVVGGEAPAADTAADTGDAAEEETPADTASGSSRPKKVFIIPIEGPIDTRALVVGTRQALEKAKKRRYDLVVFHIDTPGGRVDVANTMIQLIDGVNWAPVIAWVHGSDQKGAISAGAYISLSCEKIYMASAHTLGGAVPFHATTFGHYEVDAKMQSIFSATFRALAEKRGHPSALVNAMVDSGTTVIQVFVDDEQKLVTDEEATQLEKEHRKDGKFRRGKTVVQKGKILTLTTDEAMEYGLAKGIADDIPALMVHLGIPNYTVSREDKMTEWVDKTAQDQKKRFETAKNVFVTNIEAAQMNDPARFLFPDQRGTARWKQMTKTAMQHLQKCAAAIKEIEKIAADPDSDIPIPQEDLDELKAQLEGMYQRLGAQGD